MRNSSVFGTYVAVLRKHVLLLCLSMALVLAAGTVYLLRQQPVFRASAFLLIEEPVRNQLGPGAGSTNFFAITSQGLNTELFLLRNDEDLAARTVARLRNDGVDVEAGEYTPRGLMRRVSVSQMPGTKVVEFTLTGPDAETLPAAVNAYANEYRQFAEDKRSATYQMQREGLLAQVAAAEAEMAEAERVLREFAAAHTEHDLAAGANPAARTLDDLTASVLSLANRDIDDATTEDRITDALEGIGITVERDQSGSVTLRTAGDSPTVEEALAADLRISGLPLINTHRGIDDLRVAEASAVELDRRLEADDYREASAERKAARARIDEARRQRGWLTARTIEAELTAVGRRRAHYRKQQSEMQSVAARAAEVDGLLGEYRRLSGLVGERRAAVNEARTRLSVFDGMYLTGDGEEDTAAKLPRVRIEVRVPAEVARQVAPNPPIVISMTVLAALLVGVGLVFVFEFLDDSIRSRDDFDRYVGLPFLGHVPHVESTDERSGLLVAEAGAGSAVAEAFRTIRTSIVFSRADRPLKTLLITSAGPSEGKTTIASNLAAAFARHRGKVLLIDADLRRPRVGVALGLPDGPGLTNALVGAAEFDDVVRESGVEGLDVITSGPSPPNPAELLHGERMAEILEEASKRYERVIIDSPPVVAVTDARVLASCVDGLYIVIAAGRTSRRLIQRAVESLTSIGFAVDGAVLNGVNEGSSRYGDYYTYSRYAEN